MIAQEARSGRHRGGPGARRPCRAGQAAPAPQALPLGEALTGRVTAHRRFLLDHLLRHIEFLDGALAPSLLVIPFPGCRCGGSFRKVGIDSFARLNADRLTRYHTKRLAALGYAVTLTKAAA